MHKFGRSAYAVAHSQNQHDFHRWKLRVWQAELDGRRHEEVMAILDEEMARLKAQEAEALERHR
jgi:hypothetical protein